MLPRREWNEVQRAAVSVHLDTCDLCRAELAMEEELEFMLRAIPLQEAPQATTAIVLARCARLERSPHRAKQTRTIASRAAAIVGVGMALGAYLFSLLLADEEGLILDLLSLTPASLFVALGVLLFLLGLFTSVKPSQTSGEDLT